MNALATFCDALALVGIFFLMAWGVPVLGCAYMGVCG